MRWRGCSVVGLLAVSAVIHPCLPVTRYGIALQLYDESAIVAWDSKDQVEHFIRRASFRTKAKDIGFLVPTPSVPTLHATDPTLFWWMHKTLESHRPLTLSKGGAMPGESRGVEVVRKERVGGYEATILKANDAGSAERWLRKNGYPVSASTRDWLRPYVQQKWTITAFKIARGASTTDLAPVRMSFRTPTPVYPYREPLMKTPNGRIFRLFVLTDRAVSPKHGTKDWKAYQEWSGNLHASEASRLSKLMGLRVPLRSNVHLTSYVDGSSPRDGSADLWFPAKD